MDDVTQRRVAPASAINAVLFGQDELANHLLQKEIAKLSVFQCGAVGSVEQLREVCLRSNQLQYVFYVGADAGSSSRAPMNSVVKFIRENYPHVFIIRIGNGIQDAALKVGRMNLYFAWSDFYNDKDIFGADFLALKLSEKIFFEVAPPARPRTVLLAEAMQSARGRMREQLGMNFGDAIKIVEASSAKQALNILQGLKVDLLISGFEGDSFEIDICELLRARSKPTDLLFFVDGAVNEFLPGAFTPKIVPKPDYERLVRSVGEFLKAH